MSLFLRVVLVFFALVVVAAAAAWLSETPGAVAIDWRGYRIETSVAVLAVLLALFFVVSGIVFEIFRATRRLPKSIGEKRSARRRETGYLALTRGMIAIAEGDINEAKRQAKLANDILGRPPGALLIGAQAAQMEGKPGVARKFYEAMAEQPETELLGVRGLLTLAEGRGDTEAALQLADRARKLNPKAPWALTRLFHLQIRSRRWEEAESTLRSAIKASAVGAEEGREQDAALLVQLSLMAERGGNRRTALEHTRKALRSKPDFLPATLQLAALQIADGRTRQARRTIEDAWDRQPHPDLARLYSQIAGTDELKSLKAMETLEKLNPDHRDTHLAMARAALDAKMWGQARRHLQAGGREKPDAAYCRLFAELEQSEKGDIAAARDWLARAADAPPGPSWLCDDCGATAREWSALCGHCGAFDTLHWKTPPRVMALTEGHGEVVEATEPPAPDGSPAAAPPSATPALIEKPAEPPKTPAAG
ncbi:MAG: heme biosynthesis HemY N-terminal domain-containing protein [Bauldia litoralis]